MTDELEAVALRTIGTERATDADLHVALGAPAEWKTMPELMRHVQAGAVLGGLVVQGLAYIAYPFRDAPRYRLTGKGRAALAEVGA